MLFYNETPVEYNFGGSRARLLVPGEQTANAFCMLEIEAPAGRVTPMHQHANEDETVLMLEGELDVTVDGTPYRLERGASIVLPRGSRHQLINSSDAAARYLVICAPAGFDRFVDACADKVVNGEAPPLPDDAAKARMREAAARFEITLFAPPAK